LFPLPPTASFCGDFAPLFVGISLLAFGQAASIPPQLAQNRRKSWLLSVVGTGPSFNICAVTMGGKRL